MPVARQDRGYLEWAMALAERGRGLTSPNPMVGAVIVSEGRVLGEGFHVGPGHDHAEIAAIRDALRRAGKPAEGWIEQWGPAAREICAGATLYVTLEPCCVWGRTPPCTDALLAAGISRVVAGAKDPSPLVNGKGFELLLKAGVLVELAEGDLAHRLVRQNDGARKLASTGLPFVTYKYATTIDGRVATDSGDSRWISSQESRALVHSWRAWSDAVVVGVGTLLRDDPRLTAREVACQRQPLRVVIDRDLQLPRESALVTSAAEGPVLAVCGPGVGEERRAEVERWGIATAVVPLGGDGRLDPVGVLQELARRGVVYVLLEGGPRLAGSWWAAGVIDKVAAFVCPVVACGSELRAPLIGRGVERMADALSLVEVQVTNVGRDVLVTGYTRGPY